MKKKLNAYYQTHQSIAEFIDDRIGPKVMDVIHALIGYVTVSAVILAVVLKSIGSKLYIVFGLIGCFTFLVFVLCMLPGMLYEWAGEGTVHVKRKTRSKDKKCIKQSLKDYTDEAILHEAANRLSKNK